MNYIKTKDNVKLAYNDIGNKHDRVILFVHGWPLDSRIFEYQLNVLPSMGYRCITVDIRGFGASDETNNGYDYNTLSEDLYELITSLKLNNIILVGFSMGGAIVTRYMSNYNGYAVKKLALLSAAVPTFTKVGNFPYGKDKGEVDILINNLEKDRPKTVLDFGKDFFYSNISPEFRDYFNNIAMSEGSISTIKAAISLKDERLFNNLEDIKVSTGIFHGVHDKICEYALAETTHKLIPQSKLYKFNNSGHAVYYDELELFNQRFIEFIED